MSKRVLLISYYFYPDVAIGAKRPSQLVKALIAEGWSVDVITNRLGAAEEECRRGSSDYGEILSIYHHPGILNPTWKFLKRLKQRISKSTGVESTQEQKHELTEAQSTHASGLKRWLLWLRSHIFSLQSLFSETKAWAALSLARILLLWSTRRKYDLVISTSPPDSVHFLGLISKKLFNAPLITDLRDPLIMWEEVDPQTVTKFRQSFEESMEKTYYKNSDHIVVTSPRLEAELLHNHGLKVGSVTTIYNGFDGKISDAIVPVMPPVKGVFAGNLYFKRNPIPLFEAIKELKKNNIVNGDVFRFDFYGDCAIWNGIDLREWLEENGIDDIVSIKGLISPQEVESILGQYHILLNFTQFQPRQIPAKTFEYLRFPGRMLLISEPGSDAANLVKDDELGVVVAPDRDSICRELKTIIDGCESELRIDREEMSRRMKYSRELQNRRYVALAERVAFKESL
ncbi:tpr/glycosyl transferase domain protein [Marinobacter nitratireducens]|uniref:Tpr/glycosyl transferase domain protein n=1 Tax=Marinobacter nitratireducens TaxID=1137280 RepID=A0A072N3G0_9GAMM|nr:glycosyltransferase [Marinobacter nitratireducens]KEF32229.1 tpr/glycosyl transferase domain protein [Marinobacter nitratireducens]